MLQLGHCGRHIPRRLVHVDSYQERHVSKENPDMVGFLGRVRFAELTRFIFEIFSWLARLLVRSPLSTSPHSPSSPDYPTSLTVSVCTLSLFRA